jgi:hypothetical protein
MYQGWPFGLPWYLLACGCRYGYWSYTLNIRMVPLFIIENWMAANRVNGATRFYYGGKTFTIQEARQELAERRDDD